jgi:hypothetical protein
LHVPSLTRPDSLLVACPRTMQPGQKMPGPLYMMLSLGAGAFLHQISEHSMIVHTQPVAAWQIDGTGA